MLDLIGAYENYLTKVKQASGNTISSYLRDIRQFAGWLHEEEETEVVDATELHIQLFLTHLESEGRSAATRSRALASLKNFYSYVVSAGFLAESPVKEVRVDRGEKKLPQILTNREIELLLAQPSSVDPKGIRDKAMLEVMYATGIRVSELIGLDITDVHLESGIIKCRSGKKSRTVLLPGSGVSLEKHKAKPYTSSETVNFLYIARVMKEKGIDLYLACSKEIHDRYPNTLFHICGMCDDEAYLEILKKAAAGEVDPLTITAFQYDLVCNGVELSSGAVRNHDPEIMIKAFELVRLGEEDVKKKFPAMYNAFTYGAPPHAGIAPGVDRMVMLLAGESSIREIIPFPMNKNAQDIMMGAPSEVEPRQLEELHIAIDLKEE